MASRAPLRANPNPCPQGLQAQLAAAAAAADYTPPARPVRPGVELWLGIGRLSTEQAGAYGTPARAAFVDEASGPLLKAACGPHLVGVVPRGTADQPTFGYRLLLAATDAGRSCRQQLANDGEVTAEWHGVALRVSVSTVASTSQPSSSQCPLSGLPADLLSAEAAQLTLAALGYPSLEMSPQYGGDLRGDLAAQLPRGIVRHDRILATVTPPLDDPRLRLLPARFSINGQTVTVTFLPAPNDAAVVPRRAAAAPPTRGGPEVRPSAAGGGGRAAGGGGCGDGRGRQGDRGGPSTTGADNAATTAREPPQGAPRGDRSARSPAPGTVPATPTDPSPAPVPLAAASTLPSPRRTRDAAPPPARSGKAAASPGPTPLAPAVVLVGKPKGERQRKGEQMPIDGVEFQLAAKGHPLLGAFAQLLEDEDQDIPRAEYGNLILAYAASNMRRWWDSRAAGTVGDIPVKMRATMLKLAKGYVDARTADEPGLAGGAAGEPAAGASEEVAVGSAGEPASAANGGPSAAPSERSPSAEPLPLANRFSELSELEDMDVNEAGFTQPAELAPETELRPPSPLAAPLPDPPLPPLQLRLSDTSIDGAEADAHPDPDCTLPSDAPPGEAHGSQPWIPGGRRRRSSRLSQPPRTSQPYWVGEGGEVGSPSIRDPKRAASARPSS